MRAFWDVLAVAAVASFAGLAPRPSAAWAQEDAACLACHGSPALFEGQPDAERLVVRREELAGSVHAPLACVDCHRDLAGLSAPHREKPAPVECGACHSAVDSTYGESVHGYAVSRGAAQAPTCATCHGTHDILPSRDPRSRTHRVRVPGTCADCHGRAGLRTEQLVKLPRTYIAYAQSVHGRGMARGLVAAASCTDCHGVHDLKAPADPSSRINRANVAATCGGCHPDIQLQWERSIHGRALKTGIPDSPTCTDCHGEHFILSPVDPDAATYAARLAAETCGPCHEDPIVIAKYGLEGGVVGSYVDSYHGWAVRLGGERAATCVSCHTAHLVLPADDPASTINPANVIATCRACHPEADERFVASYTHESVSVTTNPITRAIRKIYLWLIGLVVGGMLLHNLVIMGHHLARRLKRERGAGTLERLERAQLVQHLLTVVSFVVLVVTGFALRFPEAWWVQGLTRLGMTELVRGDLHRIFAVVLMLTAAYHVYYVAFTARGREAFGSIVPTREDIRDVLRNLRHHLGLARTRPEFGRYDYTQKVEYWALVWGTVIMALTGLVLWFPSRAVGILPSWIVPVAQTIHYYEAWLATLAVVVWHFFFVIFHPDVYPMTWSWLTGRMSEETARRHHPRWYRELVGARAGRAPRQGTDGEALPAGEASGGPGRPDSTAR